jgi:Undecaprenyl-phosphate glucose phosphotransferase
MTYLSQSQALFEECNRTPASVSLVSYQTVSKIVATADYLLIVAACVAADFGYSYFFVSGTISGTINDVWGYAGLGTISATIFVLLSASLYHPGALISLYTQLRGILFNWMVVLLIICLMFFLLKIGAHNSRGAVLLFSVLGFGMLVGWRLVISTQLSHVLARGALAGSPAIVIGDRQSLAAVSRLQLLQKFGAREMGRFELPPAAGDKRDLFAAIDQAIDTARSNMAERVLLALQWIDERERDVVCERLQVLPIPVLLLPDQNINSLLSQPTRKVGVDFTIELQRPPLYPAELALKRTTDLLLAGALLVLLCPLLAIVAFFIKVDSHGPAIFRQRRKGFNGREFTIYKFRTMKVIEDGDVIRQAQRNDARLTRLGRILRATSIDELPQLINVLRGQMSFVGPRPHAVAHDNAYSKLIAKYAFRQHVKPGLTGWAQVHGLRGETAQLELMEQRVSLDLWYIKHWSIWLDLRIVVFTCFELIRRRNVY